MSSQTFEKIMNNSIESNVSKSVRRIYLNGLYESTEERGYWHIDTMSGMGSCTLIKFDNIFFLLTLNHVLKGLTDGNGNFQNESPFWTSVKHQAKWESMYDFLMPKKIWNIGELIHEDELILTSEVCLVELFYPGPLHMPDNFIDLDSDDMFSSKNDFYEGRILQVSGFPFEKNSFNWDIEHPEFTHSTNLIRHSIPGLFMKDSTIGYISFKETDADIQHKNVNGMSGGIVYDIHENLSDTQFCGIISTISNNICRFIPSYMIQSAIINYKDSSNIIVDPAANKTLSQEEAIRFLESYYEETKKQT